MDSFNVPVEYINKHIDELEYVKYNILYYKPFSKFLIFFDLVFSQSQQAWIDKLTKENAQLVEALKSYNPEVFDAVSNREIKPHTAKKFLIQYKLFEEFAG